MQVVAAVVAFGLSIVTAHAQSLCEDENLPERARGLCRTPLFKSYVACVEKNIPVWDPKGPVLSKNNFPVANSVLAVLVECEPIARRFGKKYGNGFANAIQSTANRIVSKRYGTDPMAEPSGDTSKFLEYGERVDPRDVRPGDVAIPKKR